MWGLGPQRVMDHWCNPKVLVPSQEGKILVIDEDFGMSSFPKCLIWELTYPNVIVLSCETLLYSHLRWIDTPHASKNKTRTNADCFKLFVGHLTANANFLESFGWPKHGEDLNPHKDHRRRFVQFDCRLLMLERMGLKVKFFIVHPQRWFMGEHTFCWILLVIEREF